MYKMNNCQDQADFFYDALCSSVNKHAPRYQLNLKENDKPWVTASFKNDVTMRNKALAAGNLDLCKKLRNRVNRESQRLKAQFVRKRLANLKTGNSKRWWTEIKALAGFGNTTNDEFSNVMIDGEPISQQSVAEIVGQLLIDFTGEVHPFNNDLLLPIIDTLGHCPDQYIVSEFQVFNVLKQLDTNKAVLFDCIDNSLLRVLAPCLSAPICALINSSIALGCVPSQWRLSRIALVPKVKPVTDLTKDLRPIAITCPVSKIVEYFVDSYFSDYFTDYIDDDQFGNTKGRSTLSALIVLTHSLFNSSDDAHNFVRVLFVDFRKAFELIDHTVLFQKLNQYNCPNHLKLWLMSFLTNRAQFIKIGNNYSPTLNSHAGAPQGTRAGPNAFKVVINDLSVPLPTIKYVDDVSIISVSNQPDNPELQNSLYDLHRWCVTSGLCLNIDKIKELVIHFGKIFTTSSVPLLTLDGEPISRIDSFKVLGIIVSSDLTWNAHVAYIVSKACKRLYVVYQLLRSGVACHDIVNVYCSLIRPVLEYCCPVWHPGLTRANHDEIESVQRRVLKLIFPQLSYHDALFVAGLEKLETRRQRLSVKVFNQIKSDKHILNKLLVRREFNSGVMNFRAQYPYILPRLKTDRAAKSLIWYGTKNKW